MGDSNDAGIGPETTFEGRMEAVVKVFEDWHTAQRKAWSENLERVVDLQRAVGELGTRVDALVDHMHRVEIAVRARDSRMEVREGHLGQLHSSWCDSLASRVRAIEGWLELADPTWAELLSGVGNASKFTPAAAAENTQDGKVEPTSKRAE